MELGVGLFLLVGLSCMAYLSFKLGDINVWGSSDYEVSARFSNVGGLKDKAEVTMAGVVIGQVRDIRLKDGQAVLTLSINKNVRLEEDVIASIKTMGIIGDKYVSISPGASEEEIKAGGMIQDTQPPLDIENLVSKFVFGSADKSKQ
jgi:phospholipid/cholesterol/gamma-HCH transport system substrate-binding protein